MAARHPSMAMTFIDTRGSRHIALSPLYLAAALCRIVCLRLARKVSVLHINVASRGSTLRKFFVFAVANFLHIPTILHLHAAIFEKFYAGLPGFLQRRVRWMFRCADRVVVLGSGARRFVVDCLGVLPESVEVISNGVPCGSRSALPMRSEEKDEAPRILFAGRLGERKGVGTLLEALASPLVARHAWRAVLAGDGDATPYRTTAQRLGIANRVEFPGWLDQARLKELLEQATMLVLPSRAEGLPMSVLEGLAHGLPVIATPVGSLPDSLVHEKSVLFVEPDNTGALAAALDRMISDKELRTRVARAGHETFLREFDIAVIADRFAEIYRELGDRDAGGQASSQVTHRAA